MYSASWPTQPIRGEATAVWKKRPTTYSRVLGLTRARGVPTPVTLGRTLRPIRVSTVSTRVMRNQNGGVNSRSSRLPALVGSLPGCRPDSQVFLAPAISRAISAPELPAPTTSVGPSRSWEGRR
jgi:hypothetical protein